MRRVAPWSTTGLVAALAAAAAVLGSLGVPGQSAAAWVRQLLATTKAAGTAHVVFTAVVTGADPPLHERTRTVGVADLRRGNFDVTTTQTASASTTPSTVEQVGLGRTVYSVLHLPVPPRIAVQTGRYLVMRRSRPAPDGALGLGPATGAVALLTSSAPVVSVRRLGTGTVGHAPATQYQVVAAPHGCTGTTVSAAVDVSVDGQGRLVRAVSVQQVRVRAPGGGSPARRITIAQTVRLSHFGARISIVAPRPTPTAQRHVSGSATVHQFSVRRCA